MALSDEQYLLFTTYRRSGEAVSCPVWCVPLDEHRVGFWTSSGSGKAKRLAHTPDVTVQGCNRTGQVREGTSPVQATAALVTGQELEVIRAKVIAKYGKVMPTISKVMWTVVGTLKRKRIPYGDRGVVVTLGPGEERII